MPIYEYRCDNCGHQLEAIQKLSEEPLKACPQCKTDSLVKKISAAGFRLKGSGWYETDFKTGGKKNIAGDSAAKPAPSSTEKAPASSKDTSGKSKSA